MFKKSDLTFIFLCAIGYFLAARMGLLLASINSSVSPVWPATGVAIFMVVRWGFHAWPAVFIGAFIANLSTSSGLLATSMIACGNTLEALVAAMIIQRVGSFSKYFSYQATTLSIFLGTTVGSLIGATVGTCALLFFTEVDTKLAEEIWQTWWIGDSLGGLVVAPLLLNLHHFKLSIARVNHSLATFAFLAITLFVVFFFPKGSGFLFIIFPVLLYSAIFLRSVGVLVVALVVSAVSIWATSLGYGPFARGLLNERLVDLQLFLVSIALTALVLSNLSRAHLSRMTSGILILCWTLSGFLFWSFESAEKEQDQASFHLKVEEAEQSFAVRIAAYEQALKGAVGLFAASDSVEWREWKNYFETLKIMDEYPGINGMGVIWPVAQNRLSVFEAKMKREGLLDFKVHPVPGGTLRYSNPRDSHYVIKFVEPRELNLKGIGLDIGSNEKRRKAAESSRDTGFPTITEQIRLVQDPSETSGFLFFAPIYKNGMDLTTVEERRRAHLGWVFAPFIHGKFFGRIIDDVKNQLEVRIYSREDMDPSSLAFDNYSDPQSKVLEYSQLKIGERTYRLAWTRGPAFVTSQNTVLAWMGLAGAMASLFMMSLVINLQLINRRSREIANDLTKELVISQKKFLESELRLRFALEGSNDGIWDWNLETNEMYVSEKISQNFAWPQRAQLKSILDLKDVAHPDDHKYIRASMDRLYSGISEFHEVRNRFLTQGGEWRWLLTRGKVSDRFPNGKPKRITGVLIDIHEMVMAKERMDLLHRQLENIANSIPVVISQWDRELKFIFGNKAFHDWYGADQGTLIDRTLKEIVDSQFYDEHMKHVERVLQGEPQSFERTSPSHIDGRVRNLLVSYLPDQKDGVVHGFFIMAQDVTDLKKAEFAAIEERKAALEASSVKSQFLANMSHEIRTPINGIMGMAELLSESDLSSQQAQLLSTLRRSADGLLNVVNDILDISKVEAGKLEIETIEFDLNFLISDFKGPFEYMANEKNLELSITKDLKSQTSLLGDPSRIRQVLNNLVGNAIKFTSQGRVTIACELNGSKAGYSLLKIQVTDTGIGIPKTALGKMFQAFSQADSSTSRRFGGTGLGLSICKNLVELMGGQIGVESVEGQGSTFWFTLEMEHGLASEISDHGSVEPKSKSHGGARVLVAEDNTVNQQVILAKLRKLGYRPQAVGSGKEVLEALCELNFDIILMDCKMPDLDGFETTKIIRKHESLRLRQIPIIALTASAMSGDKELCIQAGMNDYVSKPFKDAELLSKIERLLRDVPLIDLKSEPKGHILIVEDNSINQEVISLSLKHLGYSFEIVENGLEGLIAVQNRSFDLILMDCQMPVMDGYQAAREIRRLNDFSRAGIPIIAVTANAIEGDREKCLAAGMNDYLSKPLKSVLLEEALQKWMRHSRASRKSA